MLQIAHNLTLQEDHRGLVDAEVLCDAGAVENLFSFQTLLIYKKRRPERPTHFVATKAEPPAGLAAACAWKGTRTSFPCV